jgi:hypothetical protein
MLSLFCMETTLNILSVCLVVLFGSWGIYLFYTGFRDERKALAKGMLRPRKGFSVQLTGDSVTVLHFDVCIQSHRIESITRTEHIRDNCFDRVTGIEDAVKLFQDSKCVAHVGESANNYTQLLEWARKHPNHKVIEVELCI